MTTRSKHSCFRSVFRAAPFRFPAVLAALFCTLQLLRAAEENIPGPASIEPPPVVRTEEDVRRGKENVKNVMEELTAMLTAPSGSVKLTRARHKAAPPYCKIIHSEDGRATLVFRPRYTTAKQMFTTVDSVVTGSTYLEYLQEQNLLVLSTSAKSVESYRQLFLSMDVPTPQILIEAKIVEVTFSDGMQRNFSFKWQNDHGNIGMSGNVPGQSNQPTTGLGSAWSFDSGDNNFSFAFQWLRTADDAKVLSSPNILITGNETSRIETGSDVPIQEFNATSSTTSFTTKFKRVGVTLEVEPKFISNDTITLRVLPSVSNISSYETVRSSDTVYAVPVISIRKIESYLRMRNEQVVMLGGLYSSTYSLMQERTPFLSDIPLIGELFTGKRLSKEVKQLIFFMKVHIIPPDEEYSTILYDPDEGAATSENIGKLLGSIDSFPIHRGTLYDFEKEIRDALPGEEVKNRESFRLDLDRRIDSWFAPEPEKSEKPEKPEKPEKTDKPAPGAPAGAEKTATPETAPQK